MCYLTQNMVNQCRENNSDNKLQTCVITQFLTHSECYRQEFTKTVRD